MKHLASIALALLLLVFASAAAGVEARVDGEVRHPGPHTVDAGTRFAELALAAAPTDQAYLLGATVLRSSELAAQRRMKAGLEYDLEALAEAASLPPEVVAQLPRLRAWLAALPVTGRLLPVEMDPRLMEADRRSNRLLAEGDRFVYPRRPDSVRVAGAVAVPCELPHTPLREAASYLLDCPAAAGADPDVVYAIQPDGVVQRLGIAAWNRSRAQTLAPGALLYVPLDERALQAVAPGFNTDMAAFLATQYLPAEAP